MTNLTTAAKAVKDAAQELYADRMARKMAWPLDLPVIAVALRAVADQVVPTNALYARSCCESACEYIRADLLAIATELEAE